MHTLLQMVCIATFVCGMVEHAVGNEYLSSILMKKLNIKENENAIDRPSVSQVFCCTQLLNADLRLNILTTNSCIVFTPFADISMIHFFKTTKISRRYFMLNIFLFAVKINPNTIEFIQIPLHKGFYRVHEFTQIFVNLF